VTRTLALSPIPAEHKPGQPCGNGDGHGPRPGPYYVPVTRRRAKWPVALASSELTQRHGDRDPDSLAGFNLKFKLALAVTVNSGWPTRTEFEVNRGGALATKLRVQLEAASDGPDPGSVRRRQAAGRDPVQCPTHWHVTPARARPGPRCSPGGRRES
jgi:hypothetical protein